MPELKTSASLLNALKDAVKITPTADQLREQRISFIMGSLHHDDNGVTRDKIVRVLDEQQGKRAA